MGDLRINASSLIKLSRNRLDAVIEGLLHMYSTLTKSYNNLRASSEFNLKSLEEKDVSHEKFIRSKIIIFQLFSKTLSAAIGNDKVNIGFDFYFFFVLLFFSLATKKYVFTRGVDNFSA